MLLAATVGATVGSGVAGAEQTSGATRVIRFAFSQTKLPTKQTGGFAAGDASESFPVVDCQWPDGKTSITVSAARAVKCFPPGARFSATAGRKWSLLHSPIGGAKTPDLSGPLTDDIRFVQPSKTPGVLSVGPVLMQFGDYSGGARPSMVISGSSVWIYDYLTERGPEVLRISTSTGAVLQRTVMPAISRPVCAVNRYGFWMAQAGNSDYPKGVKPGIWYAPLGARHGVLVRRTNDWALGFASHARSVEVTVATPLGSNGGVRVPRSAPPAAIWRSRTAARHARCTDGRR